MTVSGHFDGKVIAPDEPLGAHESPAEESVLSWLAANAVASDALPADLAERHDYYLHGRSSRDE